MDFSAPLFDPIQLRLNHKGAEELIPSTISEFLNYEPEMLAQLKNAYSSGSKDDFVLAAHSLKGAISNVCSEPLRELAFQIEVMGKEGRREETQAYIDELQVGLEKLKVDLKKYKLELEQGD